MRSSINFFSSTLIIAVLFSSIAKAQSSRKFSIGLTYGTGIGAAYNQAIGGDFRYQFGASKQLSVPITLGFTRVNSGDKISPFTGKTYKEERFKYIPIKAGVKYSLKETGLGVYGLAEMGFFVKRYIPNIQTFLVYSPAIGYVWRNGFDLAAKYEGFERGNRDGGYVGLRLGYGF